MLAVYTLPACVTRLCGRGVNWPPVSRDTWVSVTAGQVLVPVTSTCAQGSWLSHTSSWKGLASAPPDISHGASTQRNSVLALSGIHVPPSLCHSVSMPAEHQTLWLTVTRQACSPCSSMFS